MNELGGGDLAKTHVLRGIRTQQAPVHPGQRAGRFGVYDGSMTDSAEIARLKAEAAQAHAGVVAANIRSLIAGRAAEAVYTPRPEHVVLPLGPDGGASQVLRDGVRVVVGPEETARMKGEDLFLGYIARALGAEG